jgi:acetyl-CoA acetyltransferase family protein
MRESYLIDSVRTARGRQSRPKKGFVGEFQNIHPATLGGKLVNALLERNPNLPAEKVEDLIYSTTTVCKEQAFDIARNIVLSSNLPQTTSGVHLNRYCSGALQASAFASASVRCGDYDAVMAGGGEHMNMCPIGSDMDFEHMPFTLEMTQKYEIGSQGQAAEIIAEKYNLSQEEINEFSVKSQQKAHVATQAGKFKNEIIPVTWIDQDGNEQVLDTDTNIKPDTKAEKINDLPRPFKEGGMIHAACSSGICDGSSVALWVSEECAREFDLKPRARIISNANYGVDPKEMLDGVIPGTELALKRAGLTLDDIDRFEINEAFACVPLSWMKTLKVPEEKVNVNGGAIAMGHPLGSTGGILLATMINELERENLRYGLITLCAAFGMSGTMIIERI